MKLRLNKYVGCNFHRTPGIGRRRQQLYLRCHNGHDVENSLHIAFQPHRADPDFSAVVMCACGLMRLLNAKFTATQTPSSYQVKLLYSTNRQRCRTNSCFFEPHQKLCDSICHALNLKEPNHTYMLYCFHICGASVESPFAWLCGGGTVLHLITSSSQIKCSSLLLL